MLCIWCSWVAGCRGSVPVYSCSWCTDRPLWQMGEPRAVWCAVVHVAGSNVCARGRFVDFFLFFDRCFPSDQPGKREGSGASFPVISYNVVRDRGCIINELYKYCSIRALYTKLLKMCELVDTRTFSRAPEYAVQTCIIIHSFYYCRTYNTVLLTV